MKQPKKHLLKTVYQSLSMNIISVFQIITSAEMNQRALVGKAVAVGLGVANETVKQAINATQRYPF